MGKIQEELQKIYLILERNNFVAGSKDKKYWHHPLNASTHPIFEHLSIYMEDVEHFDGYCTLPAVKIVFDFGYGHGERYVSIEDNYVLIDEESDDYFCHHCYDENFFVQALNIFIHKATMVYVLESCEEEKQPSVIPMIF